jgi:hypothetical protein
MTPRFYREVVPLGATLGKCEIEYAAALVLFALHELGRDWTAAIAYTELGAVVGKALADDREPVRSWARNPFLRPDMRLLVTRGFAVELDAQIWFTPETIERFGRHLELEAQA